MGANRPQVVITRNPAFVEYLREAGIVSEGVRVIPHATPDDVKRQHVITVSGVLPLSLATRAAMVTEIHLALGTQDREDELSLERLREIVQPPRTYIVVRIRKRTNGELEAVGAEAE